MSNGNGSIEMAVPGMLLANADRRLVWLSPSCSTIMITRRALDGDTVVHGGGLQTSD